MNARLIIGGLALAACVLWACSSDDTGQDTNPIGMAGTNPGSGGADPATGGTAPASGGTMAATGGTIGSGTGGTMSGTGGTMPATGGMMSGSGGTMSGTGGMMSGTGGMTGMDGGAMTDASGDATMPPPTGTNCLQGTGDYESEGPYSVSTMEVSIGSSGDYTIFYPDPLDSDCQHPIVAWGNGTFITGGTAYDQFNEHAATWGIVVIASHNSNVGDGTFQTAAIDYLLEQNEDSSSEFYGKLSPRAGTSGHSQGGAGADRAAGMHDNVEAVGNVQGSFGTPPEGVAFLCLTGTEDIATEGCRDAVNATSSPAFYASWDGGDHVSTTLFGGSGSDQYARLYSAWFRCFLADDGEACALFMGGADCPLCQESGWDDIFANNF